MAGFRLDQADSGVLRRAVRERFQALDKRRSLPRGMSAGELRDELGALERIYAALVAQELACDIGPRVEVLTPAILNGDA